MSAFFTVSFSPVLGTCTLIGKNGICARKPTQERERKFVGEILSIAGIPELTAQSGIDDVEAALRRFRREMPGVDRLRETAIRSEAIKHLQATDYRLRHSSLTLRFDEIACH